MKRSDMRRKAIHAIDARGALLVYPVNNKPEPKSIWSELFPRTKMRWEWDDNGDNKVAGLWHLREELSRSREVVYTKWFQGRATLLSLDVATNLIGYLGSTQRRDHLSRDSGNLLELLLSDSPLSTKQLKAAGELEGRLLEPNYNRAMKPLWQNLLILAFGEFDDSSFPSLGIGATQSLFEDMWNEGSALKSAVAEKFLIGKLGEANPFWKFAQKIKMSRAPQPNLRSGSLRQA